MTTFKKWGLETRILLAATMISISVIGLASWWRGGSSPTESSAVAAGLDTYIPKGFVLVPIDVQNYEALDSILGKFGIVDLFRGQDEGGQLIARNVRLLRAPQNPSRFAVLVAEAQAPRIMNGPGEIFVVVKPPGDAGTEFVKQESQARRIVFEGK